METIWIDGQFKKVPSASVVVINNIGTGSGGGGSFDESILEKYALKEDIKRLEIKDEEIDKNKDDITANANSINELEAGLDAINAKLEEEDHIVENGILKIS